MSFAKLRRGVGFGALSLLVGLLTWANWQAPDLHAYAAPVTMSVWQVPTSAATAVQRGLPATPGVTACAVRPTGTQVLVSLTFRPDQLTAAALTARVRQLAGAAATPLMLPPAPATAAPQCPVPAGWLLALERVRFQLNLRRFLVRA